MHELGLCEDILRAVLRRADGRRVHAARVRIGGHPVDPDVIETNVQMAAAGTPAEGIRVDVVSVPSTLRCRSCGAVADASDALALVACRKCGGIDVGYETEEHEVVLESITVDQSLLAKPRPSRAASQMGSGKAEEESNSRAIADDDNAVQAPSGRRAAGQRALPRGSKPAEVS